MGERGWDMLPLFCSMDRPKERSLPTCTILLPCLVELISTQKWKTQFLHSNHALLTLQIITTIVIIFGVRYHTSSPSSAYAVLSCTVCESGNLAGIFSLAILWEVKSSNLWVWISSLCDNSLFKSFIYLKQKSQ